MSFLAELRRRNVIRMAGLYLVGAWLAVQVAGTVLPMFGAPDWIARTLVLLLALGFVPALVFAWLYELTPDGLRRDADVAPGRSIAAQTGRRMDRLIFAGLVAAIVVVAADRYWPRTPPVAAPAEVVADGRDGDPAAPRSETAAVARADADSVGATTPAGEAASPAVAANGIAVLPFVNMSADADNEFFSDGISEELLNVLVRVDGLDVASRTSSFAYKGRELGSRRIAAELGVSYLLEGSVRKSGNTVRITAQLIDAGADRHLWSETYDRDLDDIFAIQDEIAQAIVAALREELAGDGAPLAAVTVQADTANLPAYESYLKARELFIARSDLPESVRLFEQAVALDPEFARGWEGLAAVYSIVESWGIDDRDYTALSKTAAERALQLDPSLSMPWAALGMAGANRPPFDWGRVTGDLDKAIAADAHNATALLWRAIIRLHLGYLADAEADLAHCLQIDPAYRNCVRWQATAAVLGGDDPRALALLEEGVAGGFVANRAWDFVPLLYANGDRVGARMMLREACPDVALAGQIFAVLERPGWRPDDLDALLAGTAVGDCDGGAVDASLWFGEFDRVADGVMPGVDSLIAWQRFPPGWIGSPQWKRVVRQMGMIDHWRAHGFPPQCRALGADDVECTPMARP